MTYRKKVNGRKLDYDCKKRHGADADEILDAEKKFAESYQVGGLVGVSVGLVFPEGVPVGLDFPEGVSVGWMRPEGVLVGWVFAEGVSV